jgi:UDP-glucose 4-epimerase
MKGEDLTVVAPGTQLRNFTHVSDIIDGLVLVGENGVGDNYGIGSDEKFSILEIAKMFGGDITMLPARAGNRMSAEVITEKTKALGWEAKIKIKNYIEGLV